MILDRTGLAPLALLCVIVHECGHYLALYLMHIEVERVSFKLFGINITLRHGSALSYRQEIVLALAGCAANVSACVPAYIMYAARLFPLQTGAFFAFNLMLGGFNLLPIGSLDGGRAIEAILCCKFSCNTAEKTISILSVLLIIPLTLAGAIVLKDSGYNLSLIIASVYLGASFVFKDGFTRRA